MRNEDDEVKEAQYLKNQSPAEEEKPQDSFSSETEICRKLHVIGNTNWNKDVGNLFEELSLYVV